MNQEDEFVKQQMQSMKVAIKKKDKYLIEESLRKEYCQQNNQQYIPKEQHKQGKANEKYSYLIKDKQETDESKQTDIQQQQEVHQDKQQKYQNQKQGQPDKKKQEQRIQGDRNKHGSKFQERENNKEQKQQEQKNKQNNSRKRQNDSKGFNDYQKWHSHNNNKPLSYPQVEEEENNNNLNIDNSDNKKQQEKNKKKNNNNNQQNKNSKNNNQQNKNQNENENQYENVHYKQVRRDRRAEKHIRITQSDQNKRFNKKRFNHYKYNDFDDDYDRLDDDDQFDDDYYYKKDQKNQRQKKQRRDSYNDLLKEYDHQQEDNKRNRKQYKNKKGMKKNKWQNKDFEQYWTEEQIEKGKQDDDIFEGIYIANEFTREKGTIKCPIFKKKVHINSLVETNRAFHGALVAFKITKIQKTENESEDEFEEEIIEKIEVKNNKIQKEKVKVEEKIETDVDKVEENDDDWEDVNSEDDDNISEEEVSVIDVVKKKVPLTKIQKLQKAQLIGKIVGIRKNPLESRQMIGKLCFNEKNGLLKKQINTKEDLINYIEKNYYVSFKCVNKRISFFNVKKLLSFNFELDNEDPVQKFMDYVSQRYFSAKYVEWLRNSRYPVVELIKEVGVQGNIDVECEAILTENSVYDNEFSDICKEEMKAYTHDSIAKERVKRLDLTKEYICSIDPVTARDLDDALSITDLGNGIYEIGVHIADVSHFVIPNSEVDKEAILRTTSVYLVHKVIPMLPRILCEELCSLNRDVERLAFSVFFQMTTEGEVLWDTFRAAKSVIKSCAQLSYDIVNQLIDGQIQQFSQGEQRYHIANGFDENILKNNILLLNTIAQKRRAKRLEGSLTFNKSKLRFILNPDLFPNDYTEEKRGLAQFMVEEWMLLANQFVGKKLVDYDVKTAILRQHMSPKSEKLLYYKKLLEAAGLEEMAQNLDVSTSRNLKLTMSKVDQIEQKEIQLILGFRLLKLMEAAQYFVVDDTPPQEWRHYALDFDVYTHFTSPIRRYPDILVHRRLQYALEKQEIDQTGETRDKLKAIMQHCNDCKLNARRVSDQCDQLFLALLLKANPIEVNAYVLSINNQNIEVIIPKFNLERKVDLKSLKNTYKYKVEQIGENRNELIVFYNDPEDEKGVRLYFVRQFQEIKISLSGTDTFPIEYKIQLIINNKVQI